MNKGLLNMHKFMFLYEVYLYLIRRQMQKNTVCSGFSLPKSLYQKLEEDRGDISRSLYVRRIIENFYKHKNATAAAEGAANPSK